MLSVDALCFIIRWLRMPNDNLIYDDFPTEVAVTVILSIHHGYTQASQKTRQRVCSYVFSFGSWLRVLLNCFQTFKLNETTRFCAIGMPHIERTRNCQAPFLLLTQAFPAGCTRKLNEYNCSVRERPTVRGRGSHWLWQCQ